jgi:hypothetical protein
MVLGYTAQFGNGFSATLAAEMRRMTQVANEGNPGVGLLAGVTGFGGAAGTGYGGFQAPDLVANLRVDQAWGSAQIMGALHQVNMGYYIPSTVGTGHADDKVGFVVGGGLKLNAPMIGQGDFLQAQVNYTEGALRYIFQTPATNWGKRDGDTAGFGVLTDAVTGGTVAATGGVGPQSLDLTTAWGINAAYEHFWSPRWRSSLYGGYAAVSYNSGGNGTLCASLGPALNAAGNGQVIGGVYVANPGCDMNWQTWWVGSRTQWNVTKDFYMGVDVLYSKLQSASTVNEVNPAATVAPATATKIGDVDNLMFRFRVHRDFYP